jgi:cytoskeleton protein RodZ
MSKPTLGQTLREAREASGLALGAVATATRIPLPTLEALEADRMEALPADVYLRGFVRSYCRVVRASDADVMPLLDAVLATRRGSEGEGLTRPENGRPLMSMEPVGGPGRVGLIVIGVGLAAVVATVLALVFR